MHVIQVWNIVVWQWFALQTYVTLVSIVMCHRSIIDRSLLRAGLCLRGGPRQLGPAGARFGLVWTVDTRTSAPGRRGKVVQEDWEVV